MKPKKQKTKLKRFKKVWIIKFGRFTLMADEVKFIKTKPMRMTIFKQDEKRKTKTGV